MQSVSYLHFSALFFWELLLYRAVANGRVGQVLARPIFAPEETTPIKLGFATLLSFAQTPIFIAFWYLFNFLRRNEADVRYTIIETVLVNIINERVVTN